MTFWLWLRPGAQSPELTKDLPYTVFDGSTNTRRPLQPDEIVSQMNRLRVWKLVVADCPKTAWTAMMRRALVITPLAVDVVSADAAHPSPAGRASEWVSLDKGGAINRCSAYRPGRETALNCMLSSDGATGRTAILDERLGTRVEVGRTVAKHHPSQRADPDVADYATNLARRVTPTQNFGCHIVTNEKGRLVQ